MATTNGMTTATSGDGWLTAGKSKSKRSTKAATKVNQVQSTVLEDRHGEKLTNGHEITPATTRSENGSTSLIHENGHAYQNGHADNHRRQQNGYSRPRQSSSNIYNPPSSKLASAKEDALNKRRLIEKEIKNLSKHDASAERTTRLFEEEIVKSQDRIRRAFQEMKQLLEDREKVMIDELERCKAEGNLLLQQGQERAKNLRVESERAPSMNDRQVNELRDQIKHFLAERRVEDELARTIRFQFEPDRLIDIIKNFGEVIPIGKCMQKRVSQTSLVSSLSLEEDGAGSGISKPISEITSGGICMKSDSMSAEQLAQLTQHLKESLKLQGITEDILPDVAGVAGAMPVRRRPAARNDLRNSQNVEHTNGRGGGDHQGRHGGGHRNGRGTRN